MALSQSSLKAGLKSAMEAYPETTADAATAFAQAYADYAIAGTFGANTIVSVASLQSTLESALASALASYSSTPSAYASAWATGLAAWTGIAVTGSQTGVVNGCPGTSALGSALSAVFTYPEDIDTCADGMASALHTATLTVTATVAPPPSTVLPIT